MRFTTFGVSTIPPPLTINSGQVMGQRKNIYTNSVYAFPDHLTAQVLLSWTMRRGGEVRIFQ